MKKLKFSGDRGKGIEIMVDDDVYEWAVDYKWHWREGGYAVRSKRENGKSKDYFLHKMILGVEAGSGLCVDHVNGNTLDCRRENLRVANQKENARNRRPLTGKRFKGVCCSLNGSWRARIRVGKNLVHLGYFKTERGAARAYNKAAIKHFGEFARLNEA